jgi:hypothetical protein
VRITSAPATIDDQNALTSASSRQVAGSNQSAVAAANDYDLCVRK